MENLILDDTAQCVLGWVSLFPAFLLTLVTLLPWMFGQGEVVAKRGVMAAMVGAVVSFSLLVLIQFTGTVSVILAKAGAFELSVYLDRFSVLILAMVSFLGVIVTRYSVNHLGGDPGQASFVRRLLVTVATVTLLNVAGDLLLFALAWAATSLALHRLLVFFPDRSGAKLAAKKRFIFSRIGDVCLLGTLFFVWSHFGTWNFAAIFEQLSSHGASAEHLTSAIPVLLVLAALLKSAQMPFHSWLPETMESPTPVSALMHAGIVNAGGFLVLRLSPLIETSAVAMDLLIVVGGLTAVTASLVMITQTSIKKSLAWSTISQMGFMMLQCGLGAFGLAALHILAHSLYKAHAFLSAGGIVARSAKRADYSPPKLSQWTLAFALGGTMVVVALYLTGFFSHLNGAMLVLFSVLILAVSQLIASAQVRFEPGERLKNGLGMSGLVVAVVLALHFGVEAYFHSVFHTHHVEHTWVGYAAMALVPILLGVIIYLQSQLAQHTNSPQLRRIYIHAFHGFYFGTWLARILGVKGNKRSLK